MKEEDISLGVQYNLLQLMRAGYVQGEQVTHKSIPETDTVIRFTKGPRSIEALLVNEGKQFYYVQSIRKDREYSVQERVDLCKETLEDSGDNYLTEYEGKAVCSLSRTIIDCVYRVEDIIVLPTGDGHSGRFWGCSKLEGSGWYGFKLPTTTPEAEE